MSDYSDLKFQAYSLLQRSGKILDLIAENELLARENKELRDKTEEGLEVIRTMRHQVDCYIQDAERYRWLRNEGDAMDWQFLSHQGRETIDQNIDCAMTPADFNVEKLNKALAGKRFTIPAGQTREQFRAWILGNAETLSGAVRLKLELERLDAENQQLHDALVKIIEMNRQHAEDQYGDPEKAESWSCVTVAREAMSREG